MYDPKQEPREFVGEDREAAFAKARAFFGLADEELRIQELRSGEVYGLGTRALVVAMPKDRKPPVRGERERERGGRERERGGRGRERRGSRQAAPEPAPEPAAEPSVGKVAGEIGVIGRFVLGAVERLGVGSFEVGESRDGEICVVHVKGRAAEVLSSGDARAVDALQLLANQVAARQEEDGGRVVLDVEGGSESRERHLERLAERVVRRAKESGRAVALDPMNGRDRRVIHLAVRELEGVASMSMGEGRYRQVVVVPEGAPEYEEAVRLSEAADRAGG